MVRPEVVVVAETPSLGSAVYELLSSGGLEVVLAKDLDDAILHHGRSEAELPKVLVSAPANRYSETARHWADGPFRRVPLVVVGTRDPGLPGAERMHFVTLPLSPPDLLELVRRLAS